MKLGVVILLVKWKAVKGIVEERVLLQIDKEQQFQNIEAKDEDIAKEKTKNQIEELEDKSRWRKNNIIFGLNESKAKEGKKERMNKKLMTY